MAAVRRGLVAQAGFPPETTSASMPCPPAFLEYAWYVSLAYAMLAEPWGVLIPSVGGVIWVLVAAGCFLSVHAQALRVYKPVALAFGTGILVIAIQLLFHEESAMAWHGGIQFVAWIAMLITAQALSLRPRFLHRFALAAFAIGLASVPYIHIHNVGGGLTRAGASVSGLGSANALGMWFGFCTVYFVIWGVQTRSHSVRAVYWALGLGCLFVVALTVSRGPLLGIVLASAVGLRSALKRSFVPLLLFVILIWGAYESGVFQEKMDNYMERATVESGRAAVWPVVLERIFYSLWTGVGFDNLESKTGWHRSATPHNALLYLALGWGIVPSICFLGYLAQVVTRTFYILRKDLGGEAVLLSPLVTFAFVEIMTLDTAFMSAWVVVVFVFALAAVAPDSARGELRN